VFALQVSVHVLQNDSALTNDPEQMTSISRRVEYESAFTSAGIRHADSISVDIIPSTKNTVRHRK
jgi:hypothetical protein